MISNASTHLDPPIGMPASTRASYAEALGRARALRDLLDAMPEDDGYKARLARALCDSLLDELARLADGGAHARGGGR